MRPEKFGQDFICVWGIFRGLVTAIDAETAAERFVEDHWPGGYAETTQVLVNDMYYTVSILPHTIFRARESVL